MSAKPRAEQRKLTVNDRLFFYTLERKQVKNLNLRVRPDGSIHLSAAPRVPLEEIEKFLRREEAFLLRALERCEAQRRREPAPLTLSEGEKIPYLGRLLSLHLTEGKRQGYALSEDTLTLILRDSSDAGRRRVFARFLDAEATSLLTAATERLLPAFAPYPPTMPTLKFRTMTSKWGICRPGSHTVTLNRNLVLVSPALADYVICHELAHFKYPHHGPAFWEYLSSVLPDCKARRKALNAFRIPTIET